MSLTLEGVKRALEDEEKFYWGRFEYDREAVEAVIIDGVYYPFEVLDRKYGQEGDWQTDTYVVFSVGEKTFKKTGHYASHDGEYWDGPIVEVEPHEETRIVWRNK